MEAQPTKTCSRCGHETEFYLLHKTVEDTIVLCSDCCITFLSLAIDFRWVRPEKVMEFAQNQIIL